MGSLGIGMMYLLLQRRSLNALLIGEETAMTLGTDSDRFRKQLFLVTSLLTGVMVAVSGAIGFGC
jgi:iron complex transport system permease protein